MVAISANERGLGLLLLVVVVILVYANSVHDGFHFDDQHSLVANPHIRHLHEVRSFFTDPQLFSRNQGSEMYRPLVLLSYAATYQFFDYKASVYHLFNIGIHLLMAMAVYQFYRRIGLHDATALYGALLFAVHPLVGEPVNYISSRSESLAALFFIGGLWFYLGERSWSLAAALVCYLAALMSKSSGITLLGVLLLYELLWQKDRPPRWQRLLPFAGVATAYLFFTIGLLSEAVVTSPVRGWSQQLATQSKALAYYTKLIFYPRPLSVEHQFAVAESWSHLAVICSIALLGTVLFILWRARRWRWMVFSALCCGLVLLPTLVVPLNVLVNERRLYLPLVFAIGTGLCLVEGVRWAKYWRLLVLAVALVLAVLAHQRNSVWRNEKSLWEDARAKAPLMVRPHVRLGAIYRAEGELSAATAAYAKALSLDPGYAPTHNNLGNLLRDKRDYGAAEDAYKRALAILPSYPDALVNLATLYSDQGRFTEALPLYQQALRVGGQRPELYNNLATAYLKMGQYIEAETLLRQGLSMASPRPRIYFNLGGALEGQGKITEAVQAYRQAIAIDTSYARAYYNLALLYEGENAPELAAEAYRDFLRHWRGAERFRTEAAKRLQSLLDGVNRR